MIEVFYLLNCRSLTKSIFQIGVFSNKWIMIGITSMLLLQILFTYLPVMNLVFQTAPLEIDSWLRILALAIVAHSIIEFDKWIRRKFSKKPRSIIRLSCIDI